MRYVAIEDELPTLVPFSRAPFAAQLRFIVHKPVGMLARGWVAWRKERLRGWAIEQAIQAGARVSSPSMSAQSVASAAETIAHYVVTGERESFW